MTLKCKAVICHYLKRHLLHAHFKVLLIFVLFLQWPEQLSAEKSSPSTQSRWAAHQSVTPESTLLRKLLVPLLQFLIAAVSEYSRSFVTQSMLTWSSIIQQTQALPATGLSTSMFVGQLAGQTHLPVFPLSSQQILYHPVLLNLPNHLVLVYNRQGINVSFSTLLQMAAEKKISPWGVIASYAWKLYCGKRRLFVVWLQLGDFQLEWSREDLGIGHLTHFFMLRIRTIKAVTCNTSNSISPFSQLTKLLSDCLPMTRTVLSHGGMG